MIKELKKLKIDLRADQITVGLRDNTLVVEVRKMCAGFPVKSAVRFAADEMAALMGDDDYCMRRLRALNCPGEEVHHG